MILHCLWTEKSISAFLVCQQAVPQGGDAAYSAENLDSKESFSSMIVKRGGY